MSQQDFNLGNYAKAVKIAYSFCRAAVFISVRMSKTNEVLPFVFCFFTFLHEMAIIFLSAYQEIKHYKLFGEV